MKTRSIRQKNSLTKRRYTKEKAIFKLMQISISAVFNLLAFYILKMYFLSEVVLFRILQVMVIVFISVFSSYLISISIIIAVYKTIETRAFLSRHNSYAMFFSVAIVYSLVTSLSFSFGVFWIIYHAFGDGTLITLIGMYLLSYLFVEFFAYGVIKFTYDTFKKEKSKEVKEYVDRTVPN